jgi:hypothetical protein
VKNGPKCSQPIFVKINAKTKTKEKIANPKMWATSAFLKKTAQSKQWLTGQKFAQSGHLDCDRNDDVILKRVNYVECRRQLNHQRWKSRQRNCKAANWRQYIHECTLNVNFLCWQAMTSEQNLFVKLLLIKQSTFQNVRCMGGRCYKIRPIHWSIYRRLIYRRSIYRRYIGSRYIVGWYIGGRFIVGRCIAVDQS